MAYEKDYEDFDLAAPMPTCKKTHEVEGKDHCEHGKHCISVDAECNSLFYKRQDEHDPICCCCESRFDQL